MPAPDGTVPDQPLEAPASAGPEPGDRTVGRPTYVTGRRGLRRIRRRGHARQPVHLPRDGRRPTSPGCWRPIALFALGLSVLVVGGPGPPLHDPAPPADRGLARARRGRPQPARAGRARSGPARRSWPSSRSSSTRWPTGSRRASRSSAATATAAATSSPTSRTSCGRRSPPCGRSTSCSWSGPATTRRPGPSSSSRAAQQIERLDWLAQNLLELSKLDSGLVLLDLRPDDLRAAVEIGGRAERRGRRAARRHASTSTCPTAPIRIRHDPQRIGQVVANLVGNAVKFTPRGGAVDGRASRPTPERRPDRGRRHRRRHRPGRAAPHLRAVLSRLAGQRGARQRQRPRPRDRALDRRHARRHGRRREPRRRGHAFTVDAAARPAPVAGRRQRRGSRPRGRGCGTPPDRRPTSRRRAVSAGEHDGNFTDRRARR